MSSLVVVEQLKPVNNYLFGEIRKRKKHTNTVYLNRFDYYYPDPQFVDTRTEEEFKEQSIKKIIDECKKQKISSKDRKKLLQNPQMQSPIIIEYKDLLVALFKKNDSLYRYHLCISGLRLLDYPSARHIPSNPIQIDWEINFKTFIFGASYYSKKEDDRMDSLYYVGSSGVGTKAGFLYLSPDQSHMNKNKYLQYKDLKSLISQLDFSSFGLIARKVKFSLEILANDCFYYTGQVGIPLDKISKESTDPIIKQLYGYNNDGVYPYVYNEFNNQYYSMQSHKK